MFDDTDSAFGRANGFALEQPTWAYSLWMNGTFLLQCLPFPDEQKTIYFAVFFPSLRDGDKSNHFGELKTTNPSQLFENICPATLANEHLDDPAIFFTSEAMQPLHTSTHSNASSITPYIYLPFSLLNMFTCLDGVPLIVTYTDVLPRLSCPRVYRYCRYCRSRSRDML